MVRILHPVTAEKFLSDILNLERDLFLEYHISVSDQDATNYYTLNEILSADKRKENITSLADFLESSHA